MAEDVPGAQVARQELELDVGDRLGELATVSATYVAPVEPGSGRPVLVCLPGGTYTRGYFDLHVPGHPGYSFAEDAAARGFPVVLIDHVGTGASTRTTRDLGLADQAAAAAEVVEQLPDAIGLSGPFVGVGHSMGGYVAMLQQAAHRSYAALAVLGTTNQALSPLLLPAELVEAAATADGRAAVLEQMLAAFPDRYVESSREPMRSWFHLGDVPDEVVAADDATTLTVVPRRCGAEATVPGVTADAAARIDVPVHLAYGELDVSPAPHAEPAFFPASGDVTLFVLAGSGHCHNMASTRGVLWDRLARWCAEVPGLDGRPDA